MLGAKSVEAVEICAGPARLKSGETAAGEAHNPKPFQIHVPAKRRIGLHTLQRRVEITRAIPKKRCASDGHLVDAIVAGVIDCDDDIALLGHDGSEPGHHSRRTPIAMRKQYDGVASVICEGGVQGCIAHIEEDMARRADVERLLGYAFSGGIPDRDADKGAMFSIAQ